MKKTLATLLAAFSEALADGAVILPNLMFVGLYYQHYGEIEHVMPFVLLYASEKAGVFIISCFGTLRSPRIVWLFGCILTDIGFLLLVFGGASPVLWHVCAVLIGLGLSGVPSMFRTTRDAVGDKQLWNPKWAFIIGIVAMEVYIFTTLFLRYDHMDALVVVMLALVLASTLHCILLHKHDPYRGEPVYEKNTFRFDQLVYVVIVLLFTFAARLYKQIASEWLIVCVVAGLLALLIAPTLLRRKDFRPWSTRTFWYGAEQNFVTIFSLIYFIGVGESNTLIIAYMMINAGVLLGKPVAPVIQKRFQEDSYERFCMTAACIASCLMLVPVTACYMVSVMLTAMFVSAGNGASLRLYLKDERFPATERRLVRARFYGLGAVVEQSSMLIVLFAMSALLTGSGSEALAGYAFQNGSSDAELVFRLTLVGCLVINGIWAWRAMRTTHAAKDGKEDGAARNGVSGETDLEL